jgi:hypothetical protein
MGRDVEWLERKGRINIKALTQKAVDVMLEDMGLPVKMGGEVFFMGVDPHSLDTVLARLRAKGLQTHMEQVDISALTDF